jgi:hypothetical protein
MMLGNRRNGERNRSILLAYLDGHSIDELAAGNKLMPVSIRAIISFERDRVCVSTEPEYCQLRKSIDPAGWAMKFDRAIDEI